MPQASGPEPSRYEMLLGFWYRNFKPYRHAVPAYPLFEQAFVRQSARID